MHSRRTALGLLGGAGVALAAPSVARATSTIRLTIASSHPTAVPWVGAMHEHVVPETNTRLEAMGSDVRVDWTESYGGALFKFDKTLEAVEQGLTDIGWVGTLWEESKMPLQNVSYYAPFVSDDMPTMLRVMNAMHGEGGDVGGALTGAWDKQRAVYLGASGIETYHLISKEPIESVAQLDGKKVVSAGTVGVWLRGTGAAAVNAGLPGFYNMLKTGVADACLISNSGTFPFKLYEVAPYINRVSIGCMVTGAMAINARVWRRLPDDLQTVLAELGREYSAVHGRKLLDNADLFEARMVEQGATVTQMSDASRAEWAATMPDIAGEWVAFNQERGLPAGAVMDDFLTRMQAEGARPLRDWRPQA